MSVLRVAQNCTCDSLSPQNSEKLFLFRGGRVLDRAGDPLADAQIWGVGKSHMVLKGSFVFVSSAFEDCPTFIL